jgi:methylphosphotriester-DNA--protein-cysteine methyltransferase
MCVIAILHHFTLIEPQVFWIAILSGHSLPIAFLIGPFLYFYTRNALAGSVRFSKSDLIHYLPFLLVLVSIFPYYFTEFSAKQKLAQLLIQDPNNMITEINFSWLYPSYWNILFRPMFLLAYAVYSMAIIFAYLKQKKQKFSLKNSESYLKWLVVINTIFLLIGLLYSMLTVHFFLHFIQNREEINSSPISNLVYVLLCSLPILMLIFPEILYDVKKNKRPIKKGVVTLDENHEELVSKAQLIVEYLEKEENLADPNLGISSICSALNLTKEEVNYCITVILQTKLATLKKQLRVELAKSELKKGKLLEHSMEGIWMKAGFTSKTSFFVSFKEVTGLTPLEYVKFVVDETKPE